MQSTRKQNVTMFKAFIFSCIVGSVICRMNPDQEDFVLDDIKWGLTNGNKTDTCIILNGVLQVMIPYETLAFTMTDMTLLTVPRNASVSGRCGDLIQNITLSWLPASGLEEDDPPTHSHSLTLVFVKRGQLVTYSNDTFSEPYFELDAVFGTFYAGEAEFPEFNHEKTEFTFHAKNLDVLSAPVGLSYFCQATEVIVSDNRESTLLLSLVQAQAYHIGLSDTAPDGIDFGPRSYCPTDGYRMMLTVAGFVLLLSLIGALIYIVLSYLRPKQRAGYFYL